MGVALVALVGSDVAIPTIVAGATIQSSIVDTSSASFRVIGNRLYAPGAPNDQPFIVKGIDAVYGHFDGGDATGMGSTNFVNAARDLDSIQAAGYNLVRISVSADNADNGYIGTHAQYMSDLDTVVSMVTARGLVAEISNGNTATVASVLSFMQELGSRYGANPNVWIKPDDEPNCSDGDSTLCTNWAAWQSQETSYVQALRASGYAGLIVVNCVSFSQDCSQLLKYPLGDSGVVYGAHRFGGGSTS